MAHIFISQMIGKKDVRTDGRRAINKTIARILFSDCHQLWLAGRQRNERINVALEDQDLRQPGHGPIFSGK